MPTLTTVQDFFKYVQENAVSDIDELPKVGSVGWFGPNGGLIYFEVGKPNPYDPFSLVFAIFQDGDEFRLYQLPGAIPKEPEKAKDWRVRPPSRWTLSRLAPTYAAEAFPHLDAMADAVLEEWDQVGEGMTSADAELELVLAHLEAAGPLTTRQELIDELTATLHRGAHDGADDDEDDEPEVPTTIAGIPPAGAGGSTLPAATPPGMNGGAAPSTGSVSK